MLRHDVARQSGLGHEPAEVGEQEIQLLDRLARASHAYDRTEIYLSESMIDEAVRSVGDGRTCGPHDDAVMRVAEAAHASHSGWVIRLAERMAASIMDANDARHYEVAARWLAKAAVAYEAAGRGDNWKTCIETLIEKHRRKYKLRPLLETLRREPAKAAASTS